jgi:hypothetical protein
MANPWEVVSVAPAAQTSPLDVVSSTPLQKRSWMDVPGEALSNILPSAANMASGLYEAVTNPVKTVSGVLDVAAGGLQNALPKPVVDFVNKFDADPQAAQRAVQAANAAGGMLKDRYGSEDALKKTFATDPVGAVGEATPVAAAASTQAGVAPQGQ